MIMPKFSVKWCYYGNSYYGAIIRGPKIFLVKRAWSMIISTVFKDNVILFSVKGNFGDFYL